MSYVARFEEIEGNLFRFDTRVYLGDFDIGIEGECIASIIGKNPGSASPSITSRLAPLDLRGDKLLPFVRNRFLSAFRMMDKKPNKNSYIRIWNLFYLCNKDLNEAKFIYEKYNSVGFCPTESKESPLNWFAWGPSDSYLDPYKARFLSKKLTNPFFYDNRKKTVSTSVPSILNSVKHTQGMPALPIEKHLRKVL
tara:strand:- start:48 stop:632 length:585 start_codon:yes stop_codon:yes gene_type:complete